MVAAAGKMLLQVGLFSWAASVFFDTKVWVSLAKSVVATVIYMVLIGLSIVFLNLPKLLAAFQGAA